MIITRYKGYILSLGYNNNHICYCNLCSPGEDMVGDVYVGKVSEVKKELDACFVRISPSVKGFLRFSECSDIPGSGDEIVVRVKNAAIKDKPVSLTMKVSRELKKLGESRCIYSLLQKGEATYIKYLRGKEVDEVVTDIKEVYDNLIFSGTGFNIRLYDDEDLPLSKLYSVCERMDELTGKKVYLKSGAFLIIEHTEALNVIDVNSGGSKKSRTRSDTLHRINLEAATEAARQIRLRNLSGMIIIDFINYDDGSMHLQEELLRHLETEFAMDEGRTRVVDITALGLAELTRRKSRPPIHELLCKTKN